MVDIKCEYVNIPSKFGKDYFIFTNIEVSGHADALNMPHTTGIKVCAGISACCYGIRRVLDDNQFNVDIRKGYFHVWTDRVSNLRISLDRDSVYALNTLVCQLYELYCCYPNSFKSFDLVDVKEKIDYEQKERNYEEPTTRREPKLGIYSLMQKAYPKEN